MSVLVAPVSTVTAPRPALLDLLLALHELVIVRDEDYEKIKGVTVDQLELDLEAVETQHGEFFIVGGSVNDS